MIISSLLNFAASKIVSLATTTEANPKTSNWLAVATSVAAALGVSKDASTGLGNVLVALGEALRAF